MLKVVLIAFLASLLLTPLPYVSRFTFVETGEELIPMRVGILYSSLSSDSNYQLNYLRWLINTMWRVPVDPIDTAETKLTRDTFYEDSNPRYALIFLVTVTDGIDRLTPEEWNILKNIVNQVIPMVTVGHAISLPAVSILFGCEKPKEEDIARVEVAPSPLTEGIPAALDLQRTVVTATVSSGEPVVYAFQRERSGAIVVVNGVNVWIGLLDPLGPSSYAGPIAMVFVNLFKISPLGFVRLKLPQTFVALRLDDVPFCTESWFWGWEYFTAQEWKRYFEMLDRHGAKVDLLIVPFNVSKQNGAWTPYNVTHGDVLEIFREAVSRGLADVGSHGATHINPVQKYFVGAETDDPYQLTETIRFEFGYNPHSRERIPRELQEAHLRASTGILKEWFGFTPILFTPPWHVYDEVTEGILEQLGYEFISADFRFASDSYGRPPSVMGERSRVSTLFSVPATHGWEVVKPDDPQITELVLSPYVQVGVPIVFLDHARNWTFDSSTWTFSVSGDDAKFTLLDEMFGPRYVTLTEIGRFLMNWSEVWIDGYMERDQIHVNIASPADVSVKVEVWKEAYIVSDASLDGSPIDPIGNEITIENVRGSRELAVKFRPKEQGVRYNYLVILFLAFSFTVIVIVAAAFLHSRSLRRKLA